MRALAKRYAKALALYCVEKKLDLDQTYLYLVSLSRVFEENKDLFNYFTVPVVPLKNKLDAAREFVDKLDLPDYIKNFFLLVVEKDRLKVFPLIVEEFRDIADELMGQVRGRLKVAIPISQEELEELSKILEEKLNKKVVLEVEEDPSIIGGVVADIKGMVFDGSILGGLKQIKEKLVER